MKCEPLNQTKFLIKIFFLYCKQSGMVKKTRAAVEPIVKAFNWILKQEVAAGARALIGECTFIIFRFCPTS